MSASCAALIGIDRDYHQVGHEGGDGGGGSAPVGCMSADDCGQAGECFSWTCEASLCKQQGRPAGVLCKDGKCNGSGSCVECLASADCPPSQMTCFIAICTEGNTCDLTPAELGDAPLEQQVPGDCNTIHCDGSGNPSNMQDLDDFDDQSICTTDSCDPSGTPVHMPTNEGMFCNANDCTKCSLGVCLPVCTVDQVCVGNNMCGPKP